MRIEAKSYRVVGNDTYAIIAIFEVVKKDGLIHQKSIHFIVIKLPECDFVRSFESIDEATAFINLKSEESKQHDDQVFVGKPPTGEDSPGVKKGNGPGD